MTLSTGANVEKEILSDIGHVEPIIGRVANRDVLGYYGFAIVRAGQTVTPAVVDKAQSMGRLFEVIAATQ